MPEGRFEVVIDTDDGVAVAVGVGVRVGVAVAVGVDEAVAVVVGVAVAVAPGVLVAVGVAVGVGDALDDDDGDMLPHQVPQLLFVPAYSWSVHMSRSFTGSTTVAL